MSRDVWTFTLESEAELAERERMELPYEHAHVVLSTDAMLSPYMRLTIARNGHTVLQLQRGELQPLNYDDLRAFMEAWDRLS